jgi:GR25 family glycosyltransferase involved in LPS biosynthesis
MIQANIIYLPKSNKSIKVTEKVERSIKIHIPGIEVHRFAGVDKYTVWQKYIDSKLKLKDVNRFGGGHLDAELAIFFSHMELWKKAIHLNTNILVLEHDAVFSRNVLLYDLDSFNGDVLNLGAPNWSFNHWKPELKQWAKQWEGKGIVFRKHCNKGHIPEVMMHQQPCFCDSTFLYGAHAYVITPTGASKLIKGTEKGILPADLFISQDLVKIHDLLPHASVQDRGFTLIQRYATTKNLEINAWDY